MFALLFRLSHDELQGFDTWYDIEHLPILFQCQDWLASRRFRVAEAGGRHYNRLVLHYLAKEQALQSSARARSQETPGGELLRAAMV